MEFTLGIPATGENFVDRAEQLDLMLSVTEAALRGKAQNSVAFLGGAGIGKTSLLLEGARRIKAQYGEQTIPIVILGGETSNEMHFLEQVRQTLGIPQKRFVEWQDLGEYLFEQVANHPENLVILIIDDFDELAYKRETFIHFLRKQYQSLRNLLLFMTLSSRERQVEKIFGYKEAFHGQLLIKKIDGLPLAEAKMLIDRLSKGRFPESVKDEIIALSEREPFFIQLLCKGAERAAEVKSILSEALVFCSPFFLMVWKDLSSQQRAILREMVFYDAAVSPTEIALKISVEPKNITIQFQRLVDLKIVKRTEDGYILKPLLKAWLKFGQKSTRSERFIMTSGQILERLNEFVPNYKAADPFDLEGEIIKLVETYVQDYLAFIVFRAPDADRPEVVDNALINFLVQLRKGNISFVTPSYLRKLVNIALAQYWREQAGVPIPVGEMTETTSDESDTANAKKAFDALVQKSMQSAPRPGEQLEQVENFKALQQAWFNTKTSARILYVVLRAFSGGRFNTIAEELGIHPANVLPRREEQRQAAFQTLKTVVGFWQQKQDMCVCFQPGAYRGLWKKGKPNAETSVDEERIKPILWRLFRLASEYSIEERDSLYQMQSPPHGCTIDEGGLKLTLTIGYIGDMLPRGDVIEISNQETITVHEIRAKSSE